MRSLAVLVSGLASFAAAAIHAPLHAAAPDTPYLFENPTDDAAFSAQRIPTVHESAVLARRILSLERIGTLTTVIQDTPSRHRPAGVAGSPVGLMDYHADCESEGNPTLLALPISTTFRNVAAGSNISLALRWHPNKSVYSAAAMPRFSLFGHIEEISNADALKAGIPLCFVRSHPDAAAWLPGNPIHSSHWARLVVDEIYWVGGFGDRAYIGWISGDEWRSVTQQEIDEARLPGEQEQGMWQRPIAMSCRLTAAIQGGFLALVLVSLVLIVKSRVDARRARVVEVVPAAVVFSEKERLLSSYSC